jgi:hypothetical protein
LNKLDQIPSLRTSTCTTVLNYDIRTADYPDHQTPSPPRRRCTPPLRRKPAAPAMVRVALLLAACAVVRPAPASEVEEFVSLLDLDDGASPTFSNHHQRDLSLTGVTLCSNTCKYANDTGSTGNRVCDDGGTGSTSSECPLGTDCIDCGPRLLGPEDASLSRQLQASPASNEHHHHACGDCCAVVYLGNPGDLCKEVAVWDLVKWNCVSCQWPSLIPGVQLCGKVRPPPPPLRCAITCWALVHA